jgi:hypothetical protein
MAMVLTLMHELYNPFRSTIFNIVSMRSCRPSIFDSELLFRIDEFRLDACNTPEDSELADGVDTEIEDTKTNT